MAKYKMASLVEGLANRTPLGDLPKKMQKTNWVKWAKNPNNYWDLNDYSGTMGIRAPHVVPGQNWVGNAAWMVTHKVARLIDGEIILLVALHNPGLEGSTANYLLKWEIQGQLWKVIGSLEHHKNGLLIQSSPADLMKLKENPGTANAINVKDPEIKKMLAEAEAAAKVKAEKLALKNMHPWARHAKENWTVSKTENDDAKILASLHIGEQWNNKTYCGFASEPYSGHYLMLLKAKDGTLENYLIQDGTAGSWIGLGHGTEQLLMTKETTHEKVTQKAKEYLQDGLEYTKLHPWEAYARYKEWKIPSDLMVMSLKDMKINDTCPFFPSETTSTPGNSQVIGHQIDKMEDGVSYHLYFIQHWNVGLENVLLKRSKNGEWSGVGRYFSNGNHKQGLIYFNTDCTKADTKSHVKKTIPKEFHYLVKKDGVEQEPEKVSKVTEPVVEEEIVPTNPWALLAAQQQWAVYAQRVSFQSQEGGTAGKANTLEIVAKRSVSESGKVYDLYLLYGPDSGVYMNELHVCIDGEWSYVGRILRENPKNLPLVNSQNTTKVALANATALLAGKKTKTGEVAEVPEFEALCDEAEKIQHQALEFSSTWAQVAALEQWQSGVLPVISGGAVMNGTKHSDLLGNDWKVLANVQTIENGNYYYLYYMVDLHKAISANELHVFKLDGSGQNLGMQTSYHNSDLLLPNDWWSSSDVHDHAKAKVKAAGEQAVPLNPVHVKTKQASVPVPEVKKFKISAEGLKYPYSIESGGHQTAVFLDVSDQGSSKKGYYERIDRLAGSFNHNQTIKADVYVIVDGHIIPYKGNWQKQQKSGVKIPATGLSTWSEKMGYRMFVVAGPTGKEVS